MSAQTPDGHHAEVHQQLGGRPLLVPRALPGQDVDEPVLGQDEAAWIEEEEQRCVLCTPDHAVEDAVDLAVVVVGNHLALPVVVDDVVQAGVGLLLGFREEALHGEAVVVVVCCD
ncbi:hypothetical protein ACIRRI_50510 [Streptomyces mirabilis]|uniref:hypothetical protein n=1 Tax=Streptomyces mirabilis TaxID=68239 RepID=UPI0037F5A76E